MLEFVEHVKKNNHDKTEIVILKGIIFRGMFGVVLGPILDITTGHASSSIPGSVGFRLMNLKRKYK